MMTAVEETTVQCPYCGEPVHLLLDSPAGRHEYVEDCQVCCQPMTVRVNVQPGKPPDVRVSHEDEV